MFRMEMGEMSFLDKIVYKEDLGSLKVCLVLVMLILGINVRNDYYGRYFPRSYLRMKPKVDVAFPGQQRNE